MEPSRKVRGCEERGDELRRRIGEILALIADTSARNVAAASIWTISNIANNFFPLRLASLVAEFEERLAEVVGVFIADWTISRGKNSGGPCPGLDPDDPATLLLLEFLPLACRSANVLTKVAQKFTDFVASTQPSAILRISTSSPHSPQPPPPSTPPPVVGAGLVISALLNGASGRAPPWALEFMPSTFGGLFQGLGNNTASLLLALKIGSFSYFEMRPPSPARVLSGKYVSRLKPAAYNDLENCVKACADSGRGGKWKDLKNALKMATGRKKKSTTYKLKPSKRSYENQRL